MEGAFDDCEGDWVQIAVHDAPLLSVQRDEDGAGCIGLRAATGRYDDCAVIAFDDGWAFHRLLADIGARQQARLHIACIARERDLANASQALDGAGILGDASEVAGRASWRERVWTYGEIWVVACSLKKKK